MPTVIDALVLEVGLDPAKFKLGKKEIEADAKRINDVLLKGGKDIEEQSKKSGDSILSLKNNVLGLFAAFTGVGASAFLLNMIHTDAQTGRTAKTIGMATAEVATWEGAAERAGAKTGSLTSGFVSLTNALKTAELTGDASIGAKFRQLFNIDLIGADDKLKTAAQLYLEIAEKAEGMDPAKASTAMSLLGIPSDVIPLLLRGRGAIEEILKNVKELGAATDADAAKAQGFETAWTKALQAIRGRMRDLYPVGTIIGNIIAAAFPSTEEIAKMRKEATTQTFSEQWESAKNKILGIFSSAPTKETLAQVGTGSAASSLPAGGAFKTQAEKEAFIRAEALKRGIDPNVAVGVAKSEGFFGYTGDRGTSFGAFQLHYGGGLGDTFTKQTGLNAKDPATEREQIKFALDQAARGGWGPWHGWKGAPFAGINGGAGAGAAVAGGNQGSSRTEVNVRAINVYPPNGDADTIARTIGPALQRDLFTQQANDGPQ